MLPQKIAKLKDIMYSILTADSEKENQASQLPTKADPSYRVPKEIQGENVPEVQNIQHMGIRLSKGALREGATINYYPTQNVLIFNVYATQALKILDEMQEEFVNPSKFKHESIENVFDSDMSLADFQATTKKIYIEKLLERHGSGTKVAKILKINRTYLSRMIGLFDISYIRYGPVNAKKQIEDTKE